MWGALLRPCAERVPNPRPCAHLQVIWSSGRAVGQEVVSLSLEILKAQKD